jgi:hypothetical protein
MGTGSHNPFTKSFIILQYLLCALLHTIHTLAHHPNPMYVWVTSTIWIHMRLPKNCCCWRQLRTQKPQHTKKTFDMCTHLTIIVSNMYTNVKKVTGLFQRNLSSVSMSRVKPQDGGTPKIRGLAQNAKQIAPCSLHMSTICRLYPVGSMRQRLSHLQT